MEIKTASAQGNRFAPAFADVLSENELHDCRGGGMSPAFWWSIAGLIISNWQDIREGFGDGITGKPARHKD